MALSGNTSNISTTVTHDSAIDGANVSGISDGFPDSSMDRVMRYFDLYLTIVFVTIFSCFAFSTTFINIVVLVKQGVWSCVTLCILALTVTDFLSTLAGLCNVPARILMYLDKKPGFDPYALYFHMIYMSAIFYDISNTLTAFLSLERCLCVCLPLKFKVIFTYRRGVAAIVCIYFLCFGLHSPHFLSSGFQWRPSESGNSTYLALWLSSNRADIDVYLNIAIHFSLTATNLTIVCVCTIIMIVSLRRSSSFQRGKAKMKSPSRSSVTASEYNTTEGISALSPDNASDDQAPDIRTTAFSAGVTSHQNPVADLEGKRKRAPLTCQTIQHQRPDSSNDGGTLIAREEPGRTKRDRKHHDSPRNLNVIKTVIALCVICFFSNLARLMISTAVSAEPRFNFGQEWEHWFQISLAFAYIFQICNCSLNIFVYYNFNQSFRKTFQRVVLCKTTS